MADPVNLRLARKQLDRAKKRAQGAENAAKHGVSKADRSLEKARADKDARGLDQHRIDKE